MAKPQKINLLLTLSAIIILSINLFFAKNSIIGSLAFLIYFLSLIFYFSQTKLFDYCQSKIEKIFLASLTIILAEIIINTGIYYFYGITKLTSLFALFVPLLIYFFPAKFTEIKLPKINLKENWKIIILNKIVIILDLILLLIIYINRTTDLLPSPWQKLNASFFLLYGATTVLLIFATWKNKNNLYSIILNSLHLFVTFSVASIIYSLGYGFDGFIHRATEVWIQQNGFILPKQPFYIGQYSLVIWLSNLTKISIFYIDIYLVPVLASIFLPGTIAFSLKNYWQIEIKKGLILSWFIPFIFFFTLNLTTPYNLALLFLFLEIFLILSYWAKKEYFWLITLLTIASLLTHPILGMPILIFTIYAIIKEKIKNKKIKKISTFFYAISTMLAVPSLFIIYLLLAKQLPNFINPFSALPEFFKLFKTPYWYAGTHNLMLEFLYAWQKFLPILAGFLGFAGLIIYCNKKQILIYPITFIALIISGWLLRSWIIVPNVADFEQGDYALRLVKISLAFLSPFAMYFVYSFINEMEKKKNAKIILFVLALITGTTLMVSFYLSYPQRNNKVYFPGYNVTEADFKTVEWIHNQNIEYDYIVLANSLVSVSALTKYSFAKHFITQQGEIFYYSIPTGGPLYKLYESMVFVDPNRETMKKAVDLAGVKKAYFVVNHYWKNFPIIVEKAKKTADSFKEIDGGKNIIFFYQF